MNHILLFQSFLHIFLVDPHPPCHVIISFLQMRKLRPQEVSDLTKVTCQ